MVVYTEITLPHLVDDVLDQFLIDLPLFLTYRGLKLIVVHPLKIASLFEAYV